MRLALRLVNAEVGLFDCVLEGTCDCDPSPNFDMGDITLGYNCRSDCSLNWLLEILDIVIFILLFRLLLSANLS